MSRAIGLHRFGGPEVFELVDAVDVQPAIGELRIRHTAIGVNFTDVHGRRGDHRDLLELPKPLILGMEAVGIVEQSQDSGFQPGDRVAYASRPLGAYSEVRNFPANRCVKVPAGVTDETLATCFLKGLTIDVLTRLVCEPKEGSWAVFHSAAGGVGTLAGQWLRSRGIRAIGIVGTEDKAAVAAENGYEAVFVRGRDDWPALVREITGGGAPVVYDPVGRDTWEGSLGCLSRRGHLVCFGNSSGLVPPFQINQLRDRGSLSLTWARFGDFLVAREELEASANNVFAALLRGEVKPRLQRAFPLEQAAQAHRLLESGQTTGALVLTAPH